MSHLVRDGSTKNSYTGTITTVVLLSSPLLHPSPSFSSHLSAFLTTILIRHMSASPEFNRPPPSPGFLLPSIPLPAIAASPLTSNDVSVEVDFDGDDGEEEECRTPTSEESRLPPVIDICPPPAPRKPRYAARRQRRPPTELIAVGAEEMEQVFGWERSLRLDHK